MGTTFLNDLFEKLVGFRSHCDAEPLSADSQKFQGPFSRGDDLVRPTGFTFAISGDGKDYCLGTFSRNELREFSPTLSFRENHNQFERLLQRQVECFR